MGPDCGTAILDGTPLGFANVVRQGNIGLVGASGTGLQEVTCQIHALGHGIRHAIGTGGRDVSAAIGGSTLHQALEILAADPGTRVIGIVSKPPAPEVAREVLERAARIDKPVVVLFLGADASVERLSPNLVPVATLYDVAAATVALADGSRLEAATRDDEASRSAEREAGRFASGQRYIRGLYSGGTFCTEAQLLWRGVGLRVHSNAPVDKDLALNEKVRGGEHTAIDLGAYWLTWLKSRQQSQALRLFHAWLTEQGVGRP